jgi:predicted transcriptional regulator
MPNITISLSDEQLRQLNELAKETSSPPEELARGAVEEWLNRSKEEFERAAEYVLRKNAELYRRLC